MVGSEQLCWAKNNIKYCSMLMRNTIHKLHQRERRNAIAYLCIHSEKVRHSRSEYRFTHMWSVCRSLIGNACRFAFPLKFKWIQIVTYNYIKFYWNYDIIFCRNPHNYIPVDSIDYITKHNSSALVFRMWNVLITIFESIYLQYCGNFIDVWN